MVWSKDRVWACKSIPINFGFLGLQFITLLGSYLTFVLLIFLLFFGEFFVFFCNPFPLPFLGIVKGIKILLQLSKSQNQRCDAFSHIFQAKVKFINCII